MVRLKTIKRTTVTGPKEFGGMGLVDVNCKLMSLKLNWLARYSSSQGKWKLFVDYWINKASATDRLGWYIFANVKILFS